MYRIASFISIIHQISRLCPFEFKMDCRLQIEEIELILVCSPSTLFLSQTSDLSQHTVTVCIKHLLAGERLVLVESC